MISYNPGYQSALKDLKHSTRQRFIAIEFNYPPREQEAEIISHEAGCSREAAMDLARLGEKVRNLKEHGLGEGVSTRYGHVIVDEGQDLSELHLRAVLRRGEGFTFVGDDA